MRLGFGQRTKGDRSRGEIQVRCIRHRRMRGMAFAAVDRAGDVIRCRQVGLVGTHTRISSKGLAAGVPARCNYG